MALISVLAASSLAKRLDKDKVVYALNCGSNKRVKSSDGYFYEEAS